MNNKYKFDPLNETDGDRKITFNIKDHGIEGLEVEYYEVTGGSVYYQYVLGKVESDGDIYLYRRSAQERNSYGGWRWEGYPRVVANCQELLSKF